MKNHTGQELELMLQNKKPLSMFYYSPEMEDKNLLPIAEFEPYVSEGVFIQDSISFQLAYDQRIGKHLTVNYIFYALAGERWRIEAMKIVLSAMMNMGRADEGIDRITGALLGYTDEEIENYISQKC